MSAVRWLRNMIFIHSSFRTGSTWFWSKFRARDGVQAFYEVFNEALATLTKTEARHINGSGWLSKHPGSLPYYLEFVDSISSDGGVAGFRPDMSYEQMIPRDGPTGNVSEEEVTYLAGLIERAKQARRIPVLSCARTLGRLAGLRRALPGYHILLTRNIFYQWCSYSEQSAHGNLYFMNTIYRAIECGGHDPIVASLSELLPKGARIVEDPDLLLAFTLLHLYLYGAAGNAADLIVDVDCLARDRAYRRRIEETIEEQTGVAIDLSDARTSLGYSFVPINEDVLTRLGIMAAPVLISASNGAGRALVDQSLADFLREAQAFSFYGGALLDHTGAREALMANVPERKEAPQPEQRSFLEVETAAAKKLRPRANSETSRSRKTR